MKNYFLGIITVLCLAAGIALAAVGPGGVLILTDPVLGSQNIVVPRSTSLGSYSGYNGFRANGSQGGFIDLLSNGTRRLTAFSNFGGGGNVSTPDGGALTIGAGNPGNFTMGAGSIQFPSFAFAGIGPNMTANGQIGYCSDCTIANPCASGGTGAFVKRLNGVNVCN